jgi:hypothetical protein
MRLNDRILRLCRALGLSGALGAALLALAAAPAHADGYGSGVTASCATTPAACTVFAQNAGAQGSGSSGSAAHTGSGQTSASPPPVVTCTDAPFAITPQNAAVMQAAQPPGPGHWVVRTCGGPVLMPTRILTWIPNGAPALPDPQVLAAQALSKITLPAPVIESSPGGGAPQTVQLPTWTWLPTNQWAPLSATASVPGESVTATATPLSVTWSWGDGSSTVCTGPGTPYINGVSDPAAASPDCGHTYQHTSASAPNQQFPVTATLAWTVAWTGGGTSGTFPNLTTTATTHWTVRQIQSLIVNQ